jgi:predicted RNase H-like nuclease
VLFLGVDLAWGDSVPGRPGNESGVVALDASGVILDAGWTRGVVETLAWVARVTAGQPNVLLFVDAPLLVENPGGQRLCETKVGQRYGRWKVSANTTNVHSPRLAGVDLRKELEGAGWAYDDGWDGPPQQGRRLSECYPYTTLVGVERLGYDTERPRYKRKPRTMPVAEFRPGRAAACDELIARVAAMHDADPPLHLGSHPVTAVLVDDASPYADRAYKHREDLLDAAICAWTALLWHRHGSDACQVLGPERTTGTPTATIIAPCRPEQRCR